MPVLFATHPACAEHDSGPGHPERPARLVAVEAGIDAAGLRDAVTPISPRVATADELAGVHPEAYQRALESFCRTGGGHLDPDTVVVPASWDAALRAAGAGMDLTERLRAGEGDVGFCAVRPPGHHALPGRAMGFCLFNNVAVTAAALAAQGERVAIVDYDAHHGNGTQDTFWSSPDVFYVSFHEWPHYPGTGITTETGAGAGAGTTINVPLPAGATGDVYRQACEALVVPALTTFAPDWLLISAGFDAHRQDPLCRLGLTAADFGDLTADLAVLAPPGRRLLFLEGGYDLEALTWSTGAVLSSLVDGGRYRPERPSAGGPGEDAWRKALNIRVRSADE